MPFEKAEDGLNMHRRALLMSAACGALVGLAHAQPSVAASGDAYTFDVALYRAIASKPGNQFVSPYSIASAFCLLYPGARGQTSAEIAKAFGFDPSPLAQAQKTRTLAQAMQTDTGGSEFTVANAAWVERTMVLQPEYARTIKDVLAATIEPVDFIQSQASALAQINAWADRETRGRIPEIISEEDPGRRLVLTNAVYFKGKWASPFSARATQEGDFHTGAASQVRAQLMHQITNARYFETKTLQAADLDYGTGGFALAVFLPRERTGLAAFENALNGKLVNEYMSKLASAQTSRLDLTLPKVEMRASYGLNADLRAIGVRAAFTPSADLSGVTANERLSISAVIQKTFLAIDEEGTEAAAVTAIDVQVSAARIAVPPPPPIEFKADHPFFIVLHHRPTRTPIFLGRISTVS